MSNKGLLLGIYFIAISVIAASASCSKSITCPCGSSNINYTHCIDAALHEQYTCERWANCRRCRANSMDCVSCPPRRVGPTCTQHAAENMKENHILFGSCPIMKDPFLGYASCVKRENLRSCTGSCFPGHSFTGMENAEQLTLFCTFSKWVPVPTFPPCKPGINRFCNLRMTGPNQAYCVNKETQRYCDISCDGKHQGRFSCSPGRAWSPSLPYCVHPTDCLDPGIPEGVNRTNADGSDDSLPRTFQEGESVYFSCNGGGSLLHGPKFITCGSNATWSDSPPQCERPQSDSSVMVTCPDPGIPEDANRMNVDGTDASSNQIFKEGKTLRYACKEESGTTLITCRSDGTWSSPLASCTTFADKICRLRVVGVGFFNCTRRMEGTNCDITCDGKLMGRFYCFDEGFYPKLPYCAISKEANPDLTEEEKAAKASCPEPSTPEGARMFGNIQPNGSSPSVYTEGDSVNFYCEGDGISENQYFFITCESNGMWSEATGHVMGCKNTLEDCPDPGIPEGGNRMYTNGSDASNYRRFAIGEYVVYDCNEKALLGANLINCTSDGKWSAPMPQCTSCVEKLGKGTCSDPGIPVDGSRRNVDGTDASSPRNFLEGETVIFYCEGLELALEGPRYTTCRSDGTWSESLPKCKIASYENSGTLPCLDPGLPKGGNRLNIDGSDSSYSRDFEAGETLMFTCKNDSALKGSSVITCGSNGTWSGFTPNCEICSKDAGRDQTTAKFSFGLCPKIKGPLLGTMSCIQEDSDRYCIGSCFPGYFFENKMNMIRLTLICDYKSWRPDPQFPPCKAAAGCSLRRVSRAEFNCSSDANGTHCDVRCGLNKQHQGLYHCNEKGEWSPSLPSCIAPAVEHDKALCLDPGVPEDATRTDVNGTDASTVRTYEEGESLIFNCKGKHMILEGSHIITCRSDSKWSTFRPQCIRSLELSSSSVVHCNVPGPLLMLTTIALFHLLLKFVSRFTLKMDWF